MRTPRTDIQGIGEFGGARGRALRALAFQQQEWVMTLTTVRILGWLVIAHGLSHAALPMRGSLAPLSYGDWAPAALYSGSIIGFVAAGLGLLGMRPFERVISPLLVLASAWSLVAIACLGDSGLWFGAMSDVVLLLVGLWRGFAGWPAHPSHGRGWHAAALAAGVCLVAYVAIAALSYPANRTWGSTRDEIAMALPGDDQQRDVALELQHAVTIDAPPEDVWVWLAQLGHDRAGFYSYDWLERAFGVNIHNVREVRPEWQAIKAGDVVHATQPGYMGGLFGEHPGWTVNAVTPDRTLILDQWGTFALEPAADQRTRFIIRSTMSNRQIPVWASALNLFAFQMPHYIMQRRMMLTIKELAEERYAERRQHVTN